MRAEQNELITRVGPGTPCGKLMRHYWQPVALIDAHRIVHANAAPAGTAATVVVGVLAWAGFAFWAHAAWIGVYMNAPVEPTSSHSRLR